MDNFKEKLKKEEYRNWVKSTLGLEQTKKCLHAYVEEKFSIYIKGTCMLVKSHQSFLTNDEVNHIKHGGTFRTNLKASVRPKRANNTKIWAWSSNDTCSRRYLCQSSFEKIVALHREYQPGLGLSAEKKMFWENSDNSLNVSLEWAIAKMFMSQGNIDNKKPEDTDPYALFHLMSVCDLFTHSIRLSHLIELKKARNTLFHSSDNIVQEQDVVKYFDHMEGLLNDASNDHEVKQDLLEQLKKDTTKVNKLKTGEVTVSMFDDALKLKRKQIFNDFENILHENTPEQLKALLRLSEKTAEDLQEVNKYSAYIHELKNVATYKKKLKYLKMKFNTKLHEDVFAKKNIIRHGKEQALKKQVTTYKRQIYNYKQYASLSKEHAEKSQEQLELMKRQSKETEIELFIVAVVLTGLLALLLRIHTLSTDSFGLDGWFC